MRYPFIESQRGVFSVQALCRAMQVSTSGYYAWRHRADAPNEEEQTIVAAIKTIYAISKGRYGSPRIHRMLRQQGVRCAEKRVARLMREHGLQARSRRRFKVTTDSKHTLPVAENVLGRQFEVAVSNARWAADITYIWTRQGWLYLAVVMDLFSRRIVGWSMQETMDRGLVITALKMALTARRPPVGLLLHSDRGSQYASHDYQQLLKQAGCRCSMSRKGNCWDNAPVESFFSTLKLELIHERRYETRQQARAGIFEFIEVWYNRQRLHSSLGYLSPADYEARMAAQPLPLAA
jgi:transposase InsO family protein